MRKFYFTSSASRPVTLEGRTYKFQPLSILGGRVSGVFDTEDATDQAILDRAVTMKRGITEISADEAEQAKKKLLNNQARSVNLLHDVLPPRLSSSPAGQLLPMAVESVGSVASGEQAKPNRPAPINTDITLPTVVSMAKVGAVKPPQPFVNEGERMQIRGRKN